MKSIFGILAAVALIAAAQMAFAEVDLFDIQKDLLLGKTTIAAPAGTKEADLPAIVECLKDKEGITLDLSGTQLKAIPDEAFAKCTALKSVILPKGLTSIGEGAFYWCGRLTSVEIPKGVTSIGERVFYGCDSLADKDGFIIVNGILFSYLGEAQDIVIPASVTSIGGWAFSGYESLTSVEIPASVASIGNYAFWECTSLTSVVIPERVTSIWDGVFSGCESLVSAVIPEGVVSIGIGAFGYCIRLAKIDVAPESKSYVIVAAFCSAKTKQPSFASLWAKVMSTMRFQKAL